MKPKQNHAGGNGLTIDRCQTPAYAIDPLLSYLSTDKTIWEPAAGDGYLAGALRATGHHVIESDVLTGHNFFQYEPESWNILVTNPPYSIKYEWLQRCYQLGKPFALLMPVEMIAAGKAALLFQRYGIEILMPNKRINFKMPNKGWQGTAQFPTCWYTWGLGIGLTLTFVDLQRRPEGQQVMLFDAA